MPDGAALRLARGTATRLALALFAALAVAASLRNLGLGSEFIGYDAGMALAYPSDDVSQVGAWSHLYAPGLPSVLAPLSAPWILLAYLFNQLGISSLVIQRFFYFLVVFFALSSAFYLSLVVIRLIDKADSTLPVVATVPGALWFAFSPYAVLNLSFPTTPHELSASLFPLGIGLAVKCLGWPVRRGHVFVFVLTWLIIAGGNLAFGAIGFVIVLAGILVSSICCPWNVIRLARFVVLASMMTLLLGAYSWLPILASGSGVYAATSSFSSSADSVWQAVQFDSQYTSLSNLWRSLGSVGFPSQSYFTLLSQSPLLILSAYCVTALGVASILLVGRRGRPAYASLAALGASVIFLFLAKGIHGPAGQPLSWAYLHIGLFGMFRNSYDKFLVVAASAHAVLLSLFIYSLGGRSTSRGVLFAVVAVCAELPVAALVLSGAVAGSQFRTSIPADYQQLRRDFASGVFDGLVLTLPDFGGAQYLTWYSANVIPEPLLLGTPAVGEQWLRQHGIGFDTTSPAAFEAQLNRDLDQLPGMGVRYVLIHHDEAAAVRTGPGTAADLPLRREAAMASAVLAARRDVRAVDDTALFTLYQFATSRVSPATFAEPEGWTGEVGPGTRPGDTLSGPRRALAKAGGGAGPEVSDGLAGEGRRPLPVVGQQHMVLPGIAWVRVTGATGPFTLAFLETYAPQWEAIPLAGGNTVSNGAGILRSLVSQPAGVRGHRVVRGFGNGWDLSVKGSYPVLLMYRPEVMFLIGAAISLATLAVVVWSLALGAIRRLRDAPGHRP